MRWVRSCFTALDPSDSRPEARRWARSVPRAIQRPGLEFQCTSVRGACSEPQNMQSNSLLKWL